MFFAILVVFACFVIDRRRDRMSPVYNLLAPPARSVRSAPFRLRRRCGAQRAAGGDAGVGGAQAANDALGERDGRRRHAELAQAEARRAASAAPDPPPSRRRPRPGFAACRPARTTRRIARMIGRVQWFVQARHAIVGAIHGQRVLDQVVCPDAEEVGLARPGGRPSAPPRAARSSRRSGRPGRARHGRAASPLPGRPPRVRRAAPRGRRRTET